MRSDLPIGIDPLLATAVTPLFTLLTYVKANLASVAAHRPFAVGHVML